MNRKYRESFLVVSLVLAIVSIVFCSCESNGRILLEECEGENLMNLEPNKLTSAQVLLRSESGKVIGPETAITSENIQDYLPSIESVNLAKKFFTEMEFDVGEWVGIGFSITAPVSKFEQTFKTTLCMEQDGGIKATSEDGVIKYELPLDLLPKSVTDLVIAITFTPPPAFGPIDFFGP
ncbi:MAG: hypothetical protein JW987_12315 [Anaerolineaceae bacterium]|nr:hypothetical protein [Anaerolineaceae bacterium]